MTGTGLVPRNLTWLKRREGSSAKRKKVVRNIERENREKGKKRKTKSQTKKKKQNVKD